MELIWIPISIFGALMQAVRTAGQKSLNARVSTMVTTYVRSIFGMPLLLLYLWAVSAGTGQSIPDIHTAFLLHSFAASIAQVAATVFLIQLFTLRNFAVGTTLTKTDTMLTAVIGSLFFSEVISATGWLAVALTLAGVILITLAKSGVKAFVIQGGKLEAWKPTLIGFASALGFCLSYLFLREASLSLGEGDFLIRAGLTVVTVTGMQVVFLGAWLLYRERDGLMAMLPDWKLCSFIGVTSALGSICWFTAMTIENASYVKSVGQVEAVFTLLISSLYFKEKFTSTELAGIAVLIAGVLLFLL